MAEHDGDLHEIRDVEVFRAGVWNQDTYTTADLDEMVRAFHELDFRPAVKLGHDEKAGGPAYGFVTALRRIGDKLVATLSDIPGEIYGMIKRHAFDRVSSEIAWNMRRAGKVYKRVLRATALLGHEIPAVVGLRPLRDVALSFGDNYDLLCAYCLPFTTKETGTMTAEATLLESAKARAFAERIDLGAAFKRELDNPENTEVVARFKAEQRGEMRTYAEDGDDGWGAVERSLSAGEEIARLCREMRNEHPEISYDMAIARLASDPAHRALWDAYNGRGA